MTSVNVTVHKILEEIHYYKFVLRIHSLDHYKGILESVFMLGVGGKFSDRK